MKKVQSLRFYLLTLECITILFSLFFIFGTFHLIEQKITTDFSQRRRSELAGIEMIFFSRLQQAVNNLELLSASETMQGGQFISDFSDIYLVSNNSIKQFIKKSPESALFTGFVFSEDISTFFSQAYFSTVRRSRVYNAPEDEKPSIYLSIPAPGGLLVGRIKINSINNDIARLVQFDGSIVLITNAEGIPYTSIGGNLPSMILDQQNGSSINIGPKQFILNRLSSIWLSADIVLLTPIAQLRYFNSQIRFLGIITLIAIIGILLLRFFLLHLLFMRPIEFFIKALNQWEPNTMLPEVPVFIQGVEEIQFLAKTFYAKANEITQMNERLEAEVQDMGKQLTSALDKMLVSEKLAVLGNLTAGLAHELNTPLGAIISTTETVHHAIFQIKKDLNKLLTKSNSDETVLFRYLLQASGKAKTGLKERMLFIDSLEKNKIEKAVEMTDDLIDMEIALDPEVLVKLIKNTKDAPQIIKTAYYFNIIEKDNEIIQSAVERASLTLKALKQWTYEEKVTRIPVSVKEEMETILTMYYHRTKYTIQIIREYLDPGWVIANPELLNAVWVNLINNAIQAMEEGGTLTIHIEKPPQEPNIILIQITDTGIGIPEENKNKIFTPFFTTKPRGIGTGIGLNLSKRIIEDLSGTISFTSRPGLTTFSVQIPAYNNEDA